jgi:AraC-like DNA-binding protein
VSALSLIAPGVQKTAMNRTVFSSSLLPVELDDRARFCQWQDLYAAHFGPFDLSRSEDTRFAMHSEWIQLGKVRVYQCTGAITRVARTRRHIAVGGHDVFHLSLNCGLSPVLVSQSGRNAVLDAGMCAVLTDSEPGEVRRAPNETWIGIALPRDRVVTLINNADDLTAIPLGRNSGIFRHLRRYLGSLLGPSGLEDDPALVDHVETVLVDLIALSLGAGREATEIAAMRGLRAVRMQEILAEARAGFADPAFSVHTVARRLNLSARYVQDLLQETGLGFTERVLEFRLQKARAMLANPRCDQQRVSDIAVSSGFAEVSYFNRCFRRRFGVSPSAFRGTSSGDCTIDRQSSPATPD